MRRFSTDRPSRRSRGHIARISARVDARNYIINIDGRRSMATHLGNTLIEPGELVRVWRASEADLYLIDEQYALGRCNFGPIEKTDLSVTRRSSLSSMIIHPNGRWVVEPANFGIGDVRLRTYEWDLTLEKWANGGQHVQEEPDDAGSWGSVAFSPDGNFLMQVRSSSPWVRVSHFDANTGKVGAVFDTIPSYAGMPTGRRSANWSPDQKAIIVTYSQSVTQGTFASKLTSWSNSTGFGASLAADPTLHANDTEGPFLGDAAPHGSHPHTLHNVDGIMWTKDSNAIVFQYGTIISGEEFYRAWDVDTDTPSWGTAYDPLTFDSSITRHFGMFYNDDRDGWVSANDDFSPPDPDVVGNLFWSTFNQGNYVNPWNPFKSSHLVEGKIRTESGQPETYLDAKVSPTKADGSINVASSGFGINTLVGGYGLRVYTIKNGEFVDFCSEEPDGTFTSANLFQFNPVSGDLTTDPGNVTLPGDPGPAQIAVFTDATFNNPSVAPAALEGSDMPIDTSSF